MTRIAVLSDIHGNLPALEAVLAEIAREGIDRALNLGDILSGPLWPRETAARLMPLGWPTIAGNHERQALATSRRMGFSDAFACVHTTPAQRAWMAALPPALELDDGAIRLTHGTPQVDYEPLLETVTPDFGVHGSPGIRAATPDEARERLGPCTASLVLCGHSHVPRVLALAGSSGDTLVVNPGSVGLPAYDHDHPHDHVVECGSPHARWAVVERTAHGWQAQLRLTAYDWAAAAARAEANGRGDWADALATGRVGRTEKTFSRRASRAATA
jgi:predicted phosphodiesterase